MVGKKIAELCLSMNIDKVCFDRGGNVYHGRVEVRHVSHDSHITGVHWPGRMPRALTSIVRTRWRLCCWAHGEHTTRRSSGHVACRLWRMRPAKAVLHSETG